MIRVLVVDDDFMVARVHRAYVERVPGFTVVGEAHTAAAALTSVRELRPDLVLLDIYLPDQSGLEVLKEIRGADSIDVDVIAVTAARDVDTIRDAMAGGVAQYLVKPFTFASLKQRLDQYADARAALQRMVEPEQDDVDRLFRLMHGPTNTARVTEARLPKGLSARTCALVATVLEAEPGDLSAAETAERAGLSRVSARRYLEHLVEAGQARLNLKYGVAGRPEHRYRWASTSSSSS